MCADLEAPTRQRMGSGVWLGETSHCRVRNAGNAAAEVLSTQSAVGLSARGFPQWPWESSGGFRGLEQGEQTFPQHLRGWTGAGKTEVSETCGEVVWAGRCPGLLVQRCGD